MIKQKCCKAICIFYFTLMITQVRQWKKWQESWWELQGVPEQFQANKHTCAQHGNFFNFNQNNNFIV